MHATLVEAERQSVMQLASMAGNMLADHMPPGVQFVILAYNGCSTNLEAGDDYLLCFRSQHDTLEAAQVLRQMADSIEDGLQSEAAPALS